MNITKLKNKVLYCLEHFEQTRNSDIELTIKIWETFHKQDLKQDALGNKVIYITKLFELPREDNIKRIRAKIQNEENKFLPTSPEIRKKRGIAEDQWREYLNYPVAGVTNQYL